MKKHLLVLLVVTLASFLFVGCLPTTPTEGEGEGEGEAEICPTVSITSQVAVGGENYIKGGKQTITVTFAVPTEPVSVYVGGWLRDAPHLEVVLYPNADKTVYTGDAEFGDWHPGCSEDYIYVETCDTCEPCKYPYTVDTKPPEAEVEICINDCDCAGCELTFTSTSETECDVTEEYCGDDCSGLASWSLDIYDDYPFQDCCEIPCETPITSYSGVCPIDVTTDCLTDAINPAYALFTFVDNVGNKTYMLAMIEFNPDTCDEIILTEIEDECVDEDDFEQCDDSLPPPT